MGVSVVSTHSLLWPILVVNQVSSTYTTVLPSFRWRCRARRAPIRRHTTSKDSFLTYILRCDSLYWNPMVCMIRQTVVSQVSSGIIPAVFRSADMTLTVRCCFSENLLWMWRRIAPTVKLSKHPVWVVDGCAGVEEEDVAALLTMLLTDDALVPMTYATRS